MVLKLTENVEVEDPEFYSSVILNGTETSDASGVGSIMFYSSVILNGTETP